MEVHGVSEKNLLKLVMKKRCAHTDKNLKLLIRIHMPSAGHNVEIVSSSRKDAKSGGELARAFCQSEGGPGNAAKYGETHCQGGGYVGTWQRALMHHLDLRLECR